MSKRFEPATVRETILALDIQTDDGPYWMMIYDDELLESLLVAAASMSRYVVEEGGACGLVANGWSGSMRRTAFVRARSGQPQLGAVLDVLARLSVFASSPFELLLRELPTRLEPGTAVIVLSVRNPRPVLALEHRLEASGFPVTHVAYGPNATAWADLARRAGLTARTARLDGGWRNSQRLDLAA